MSEDRIPMTREGFDKLKTELDKLSSVDMIEITRRVAAARDLGDLSENAEYHAAREDQGILQARIDAMRAKLARALIIDVSSLPKDVAVFGSKVTVRETDSDDEEEFHLVGPGEDDPYKNKILISSPIGQGLLGKKVGDIAEVSAPSGIIKFKILKIEMNLQ